MAYPEHRPQGRCDLCARDGLVWEWEGLDRTGYPVAVLRPESHKPICECGNTSDLWYASWDVGGPVGWLEWVECRTCLAARPPVGELMHKFELTALDDEAPPFDLPRSPKVSGGLRWWKRMR